MVHCGIFVLCIMGFVRWDYWIYLGNWGAIIRGFLCEYSLAKCVSQWSPPTQNGWLIGLFVQVGHSGCGEANQSFCPTGAPPGLLFLWNHMLYIWCKNTCNSWCFVHSRITKDVIALHKWKGDFLSEMFGTCDYCWDVSLKYCSARSSRNIIYSHSAINIW